jgi:hypothetical protein
MPSIEDFVSAPEVIRDPAAWFARITSIACCMSVITVSAAWRFDFAVREPPLAEKDVPWSISNGLEAGSLETMLCPYNAELQRKIHRALANRKKFFISSLGLVPKRCTDNQRWRNIQFARHAQAGARSYKNLN